LSTAADETPVTAPGPAADIGTERAAGLWAALAAAICVGVFAAWIALSDVPLALFESGGEGIVRGEVAEIAAVAGFGAIILILGFFPLARQALRTARGARARPLDDSQRALLDALPDPAFFIDRRGRIEQPNAAAAEAFGRSGWSLRGMALGRLVPDDSRTRLDQLLRLAREGEDGYLRCPVVTDRGMRTFEIHVRLYGGSDADAPHLIGVARDITQQANTEEVARSRISGLETMVNQIIDSLAQIVEIRDPYTHGHHTRVAHLAAQIARQMKLADEEVRGIEIAARVHDLGSLTVPFEILIQPWEISEPEHEIIRAHCQTGHSILSKIDFPWPVPEIVLQHHELFNGSGYPKGLKGPRIHIGARIICVADAFDAMTSQRPYRGAMGRDDALKEIIAQASVKYDPNVVDACVKVLQTAD